MDKDKHSFTRGETQNDGNESSSATKKKTDQEQPQTVNGVGRRN
eukprot:CAMPEP_0115127534 /NCGR_PEP_ID=MMETSP0227-20121206/50454_1 /TAXON_ID=89957 /ORGANISM="Polarella glacialis, Strain CCMP 1383" /LENGTH=43 /DNA_ID= /DNA_START= /DNA_END= /DNA_ORIENTATION=